MIRYNTTSGQFEGYIYDNVEEIYEWRQLTKTSIKVNEAGVVVGGIETSSDGKDMSLIHLQNKYFLFREGGKMLFSSDNITNSIRSPICTIDCYEKKDGILLPNGLSSERINTTLKGIIRFNTTTNRFEGKFGSSTNDYHSFKELIDKDRDTYITAETNYGNDDDTLHFFVGPGKDTTGTNNKVLTINKDNLKIYDWNASSETTTLSINSSTGNLDTKGNIDLSGNMKIFGNIEGSDNTASKNILTNVNSNITIGGSGNISKVTMGKDLKLMKM